MISNSILAHGVIGNTPVFGTDVQGSSPCGPTKLDKCFLFFGSIFVLKQQQGREVYLELSRKESLWANNKPY